MTLKPPAACSLEPALRHRFHFCGCGGGHRRASLQTTSNLFAAALVGLAAFALVSDMGACWQMIAKVVQLRGGGSNEKKQPKFRNAIQI